MLSFFGKRGGPRDRAQFWDSYRPHVRTALQEIQATGAASTAAAASTGSGDWLPDPGELVEDLPGLEALPPPNLALYWPAAAAGLGLGLAPQAVVLRGCAWLPGPDGPRLQVVDIRIEAKLPAVLAEIEKNPELMATIQSKLDEARLPFKIDPRALLEANLRTVFQAPHQFPANFTAPLLAGLVQAEVRRLWLWLSEKGNP